MRFPLHLQPDDNGTLLVTCPVLPELTTFGADRDDALRHGREAVEEAVGARMSGWQEVPVATGAALKGSDVVSTSLLVDMKLRLYLACREAGVSRADLVRRLGWKREQVERLFRIDHASRIDQIDEAMGALGQIVEIRICARDLLGRADAPD